MRSRLGRNSCGQTSHVTGGKIVTSIRDWCSNNVEIKNHLRGSESFCEVVGTEEVRDGH